jgi:hypothetical protein
MPTKCFDHESCKEGRNPAAQQSPCTSGVLSFRSAAGALAVQGGLAEDQPRAFLFTNVTDAAGRRYDIPVAVGHRYSVGTAQANAKPSGHQLAPDAIVHVSSQALCSFRNLAKPGCTAICGFALMPCTCRPTKSLAMTQKPGSIFSSSSFLS